MKKLFELIIWVPLFLIAVIFMVSNREEISVSMNPFADGSGFLSSVALPLWAWFMLMIGIGMVLGMFGMWSSAGPARQKNKQMRLELKSLKKEKTEWLQEKAAISGTANADAGLGQSSTGETLPVLTSE